MKERLIVIPKNRTVENFLNMYLRKSEYFMKELKSVLRVADFYRTLCPELDRINGMVEEQYPNHFFVNPIMKHNPVSGGWEVSFRMHPEVRLIKMKNYYEIVIDAKE